MGILLRFTRASATAFWLSTAFFTSFHALGQATPGANPNSTLGQLAAAFSGGQVVQQIQLTGTATWTAGSLVDSGTAALTASTTGSSQMQLNLASTGQRTETQTGTGSSAVCQWAGSDGVAHQLSVESCWRPALWFLPAISLQPSLLQNSTGVVDLGAGTVGASTNIYRHLQGGLLASGLPTGFSTSLATAIAQQSTEDLGLDPASLLPAVLAYTVHPDNGASTPIAIEIHYSNYQTVNGVQIPFLIQRYINGSLQLSIVVSSAQVG
jgi:hypothetical protein